jgi:GNAT superfamily N-acetyltransferase
MFRCSYRSSELKDKHSSDLPAAKFVLGLPYMIEQIIIEFLADHHRLIPALENYFQSEWSEYYGPKASGSALSDVKFLCNKSKLPIGLIALKQGGFIGSVALRHKSASHEKLSPWLTSLYVVPEARQQGVGTRLINAIEKLSMDLGYSKIFARSSTAVDLFIKNNWVPFDWIGDKCLTILSKDLKP